MATYVAYYRVSTDKQGRSGLGLEAQRAAAQAFIRAGDAILAEFTEVESGRRCDRSQLAAALAAARRHKATLLIAKLDRLSRDTQFILKLHSGKVPIKICDMPEANEFMLTIMAAVASHEAKMIRQRTKDALAAAKARGVRLGRPKGTKTPTALGVAARQRIADEFAQTVELEIMRLRQRKITTLQGIADSLNLHETLRAPRGGMWRPATVRRVLRRLAKKKASHVECEA